MYQGGNNEDDNNLGGGGHVPVRNDSREGSSGPDKKADGTPADAAVEKSSRPSTSAAKKARVV